MENNLEFYAQTQFDHFNDVYEIRVNASIETYSCREGWHFQVGIIKKYSFGAIFCQVYKFCLFYFRVHRWIYILYIYNNPKILLTGQQKYQPHSSMP